MIAIVPREDAGREQAMKEVEEVMRIRHGVRLDQPNNFDIVTQDAALKVWDQFSQATFLALVVISSIALMVGGIGVMAIMMISVTERTREIGVRKALGARRREILWQFLIEAVFLTSAGGLLGILFGSANRPRRPLAVRIPGLAAVVVLRASASASPRASASSSACFPPSKHHAWTRSRRCDTSSVPASGFRLPASASMLQGRCQTSRRPLAGLPETVRVAKSALPRPERVREHLYLQKPEAWTLRDQMLRAAMSVPANIAEGRDEAPTRTSAVPVALLGFGQRT